MLATRDDRTARMHLAGITVANRTDRT